MAMWCRSRPARWPAHAVILLAAAWSLAPMAAPSGIGVGFSVERIEGDTWHLDHAAVAARSPGAGVLSAEITVDRLVLPDEHGALEDLHLSCDFVWSASAGWHCSDGVLRLGDSPVGPQESQWSGHWGTDGALAVDVADVRLADGRAAIELRRRLDEWSLEMRVHRLALDRLVRIADLSAVPADWGLQGSLNGSVELHGGRTPLKAKTALVIDRLGFSSPDGAHAAEDIIVRVDLSGRARPAGWLFDGVLRWPAGMLYSEPLFLDAATAPLTLEVDGRYDAADSMLEVQSGSVSLQGAFRVSGTGRIDIETAALQELTVAAHTDAAGQVYGLLLQPFLIGTALDDLAVTGQAGFVLHFDEAGLEQAGLTLKDLALSDLRGRFDVQPSDGSVAWQRMDQGVESRLSTAGVSVLGIRSGPFDARALFAGDTIRLVEPIVVPLLDGRLALDRFELSGALVEGERPRWSANASVDGVSLQRLTETLDWPPFAGQLSGTLNDMRFQNGVFEVGGGLRVQAFEGEISVEQLRIRDPLGAVPVLTADASLRGLDLRALTQTFSFGRIEGHLDGDLENLQLVAWEPDRFDLHLYTPPGDRSRRRISQRAVENLTELGSGLPGGLSASFLGVFEEFSYSAIDAKVGLRGATAEIDGLAREQGGYYLVRGSGLPRIDVIGRNRRVAWQDLVERLQQIQVEGAKIE
jgi:hypothetical protein